jgi:molybdenum cofactor cytidylyltransferase
MVPGLILAAGRSSRMGRPKALLPCGPGGDSFLGTLVTTLANGGITDLIVVGRPRDEPLEAELARVRAASAVGIRLRFVENPGAEAGQLSSVLAGLRQADRPGVRGLLWIPVDMPLIAAATVAQLLAVFDASGAPIVRPAYRGAHGHPVIVARALFDELRRANPSDGARAVVRAHAGSIADVEVDDPGVVVDVDTPEDYARLVSPSRGHDQ